MLELLDYFSFSSLLNDDKTAERSHAVAVVVQDAPVVVGTDAGDQINFVVRGFCLLRVHSFYQITDFNRAFHLQLPVQNWGQAF